ncbi:MAG: DUF1849 family protein [Ectothiorhodospiraceae bacterium]|nr:DUF1849 family protein [Chromatiales bacterium]MCP5154545.1 DUF1849 family protein [Ectothiorhodospiraceae bacterium]
MRIPDGPFRALQLAVLLLATAVATSSSAAPVVNLASHRAVYALSRHPDTLDSNIAAVKGRLEISLEASCDGWHFVQMLGFHLVDIEGGRTEHIALLSGWESAESTEFWFNARSFEDREQVEEVAGVARLEAAGGPGEIRFSRPEATVKPLARGTVFPSAHVAAVVDAARRGQRNLLLTVFDGSTQQSPFEVAAAIGRELPTTGGPPPLAGTRAWPIRLAYYPEGAVEPLPAFAMSAVLYENGVTGDMVYDYGDFAIDVRLDSYEPLRAPSCRRPDGGR